MPGSRDTQSDRVDPRDMIAIVLGGGRGTRLRPLTTERAKPAVPLCGRYRLVDVPLSNCLNSGVNRIFVLTQFNSVSLHRHITQTYSFDAFSAGFVEILAAEQTYESGNWFQGTADAVRKHLRQFRNLGAKHYLILSGDQLYRMDFRQLLAAHVEKDADLTISALPVNADAARGFGVLQVNKDGRIVEFVEKPDTDEQLSSLVTPPEVFADFGLEPAGRDYLASMGIYVCRAGVIEEMLDTQPDWVDFGKDVIPNLIREKRVQAYPFSGFWEDIGTVRSYYEVSMALVQPDPPFEFHDPRNVIYSRPRYLPGARIEDSHISHSIVCEGSRISRARISDAITGIRTLIGPDVTVKRSIIMGADYYEDDAPADGLPIGIGRGSRIANAIIDKNARIGEHVSIAGAADLPDQKGDGYEIRDGIVIVLKNATILSGSVVGKAPG